jgi:hypothetical protein
MTQLAAPLLLEMNTTRLPWADGTSAESTLAGSWLNGLTSSAPGNASATNSLDRRPWRISSAFGVQNEFVVSTTIFRLSVPFRGCVAEHPRVHPVVRLGFPAVYGWKSSEEQRGAIEEGMGAGDRR